MEYNATVQYDDRGRDARTTLIAGRPIENALCCAIKDNESRDSEAAIMRKARSDLARLKKTGIPKRITFCFNAPITEELRDRFLLFAKEQVPGARLRIEGLEYFSRAASQHPEVFLEHYRADVVALQQSLLLTDAPSEPASYGLRLALVTQFGEDATLLRESLVRNMVLLILGDRKRHEVASICDRIGEGLRLSRKVDASFILSAVDQLRANDHVTVDGAVLTLSNAGLRELGQLIERGREQILEQKHRFIDEFRQRLTTSTDTPELEMLWTRLTQSLCRLLMDSGMRVARGILGSMEGETGPSSTEAILKEVALNALPVGVPMRRAVEVSTAVFSMLGQDTGFRRWLTGVASAFISLCSLGLHPSAQKEMLDRMENWVLMVDTHLVLSFICGAERDHDSVQKLVSTWARLGRRIATCDAVLEEAAYHAHAGNRDFAKLWDSGDIASAAKDASMIRNAFIREFLRRSDGHLGPVRWKRFIFNYEGRDQFDGSKLCQLLTARGWSVSQTANMGKEELQRLLRMHPHRDRFVGVRPDGRIEPPRRREWDVRLVHSCVCLGRELASINGSVIVLSRSAAVAEVVKRSGAEKQGVSVVSLSSLGYAMALTPGLSVSLPDVQDLLLEEGLLKRAAIGLEGAVRKVVDRELREGFDLAERPSLEMELRDAVSRILSRSSV